MFTIEINAIMHHFTKQGVVRVRIESRGINAWLDLADGTTVDLTLDEANAALAWLSDPSVG